jgi:hypothetical protein
MLIFGIYILWFKWLAFTRVFGSVVLSNQLILWIGFVTCELWTRNNFCENRIWIVCNWNFENLEWERITLNVETSLSWCSMCWSEVVGNLVDSCNDFIFFMKYSCLCSFSCMGWMSRGRLQMSVFPNYGF